MLNEKKTFPCFRWRIHQPIGKYIVTKNICLLAICQCEPKLHGMLKRGESGDVDFE